MQNEMAGLTPLKKIYNLTSVTEWMINAINEYEAGNETKKRVSKLTRKVLKLLRKYKPEESQKVHYENVLDLCISLSTLERAEGPFKPFYLESLKEELHKALKLLKENG